MILLAILIRKCLKNYILLFLCIIILFIKSQNSEYENNLNQKIHQQI